MKLIALVLLLSGTVLATSKLYNGYKVFNVNPQSASDIHFLVELQEYGFDFWDDIHFAYIHPIRVMVEPANLADFEQLLTQRNISYDLIIDDVGSVLISEENSRTEYVGNLKSKIVDVEKRADIDLHHFWTFDEIVDYLNQIAEDYSDIVSLETIGISSEGRDIIAVHISLSGEVSGANPIVITDGTIHAREWIATMVAINTINELVTNSNANQDILNGLDWIIVPVLNPDGFVYTFEEDRFWRKTRSVHPESDCKGADLNRNFDIYWDSNISSSNPCSITFRGVIPSSEPETVAYSNLFSRYDAPRMHLALHSYGLYMLYPYGFDYVSIDNYEEHERIGQIARLKIYDVFQTNYTLGNAASTLYPSSGNSRDFGTAVAGNTFAFTIELPGGGTQGFDIPPGRIEDVVYETHEGIRSLANSFRDIFV